MHTYSRTERILIYPFWPTLYITANYTYAQYRADEWALTLQVIWLINCSYLLFNLIDIDFVSWSSTPTTGSRCCALPCSVEIYWAWTAIVWYSNFISDSTKHMHQLFVFFPSCKSDNAAQHFTSFFVEVAWLDSAAKWGSVLCRRKFWLTCSNCSFEYGRGVS